MKAFHLIAGRAFTREKSMRYDVDAIPVGKYEVMYDVNDPRVLAEDTPNGCVREVMCCSFMDGSHVRHRSDQRLHTDVRDAGRKI